MISIYKHRNPKFFNILQQKTRQGPKASISSNNILIQLLQACKNLRLLYSHSYFISPYNIQAEIMKNKLSFAQRLVSESNSREKASVERTTPTLKVTTPTKPATKNQYMQFKQQHNELKNMLKLFEKVPEFQQSPQLVPVSPIRNRLNERKNNSKMANLQIKTPVCEAVKENLWESKMPLSAREEFRSSNSTVLPRSEPIIAASPRTRPSSKNISVITKKGIPNIGNTCYINSLVQCLFHLPHFNDYFADQKYKLQRNGKNKDVVEMYRSLYMNVMRNNSQVDLSTLPLKRSVSTICSLFIDWAQEDAHEFMKELLNSIHEDLNRVKVKPKYKQISKELEGVPLQKMAAEYWSYEKGRDDSYIYDTLCGQTYNNIRCINCNHESECFQNFMDLSLPMSSKARSLQGLLQDFFEPEKLSDYYLCGNCNKSSKKSLKTIQLWRVPKFLIIHLKRSQFGKKNTDAITLPLTFTLKQYMTLSNDKTARFCQYSLCGIIMHQGVLEGGHYWCNVKQNGKWYEIDDDKVQELNSQKFSKEISQTGSTNAYILFYSSLYC